MNAAYSRHPARIEAARLRWLNREQYAKGGGLFGGEDMQAREWFRKLPDGAAILFVAGEFAGRTGQVVREIDSVTGYPRIGVEVDGRPGIVPIAPDAIEPLDARLSWRTDTASAPDTQGVLFTADHFLPIRE